MAKKRQPNSESLNSDLIRMLVPDYILNDFEVHEVTEQKDCWIMDLREKEDKIPEVLQGYSDIVLDGFCNPLELQSHTFAALKPVFLRCHRRRWKRSNTDTHFSNDYNLQTPGVKMVKELGDFLKG